MKKRKNNIKLLSDPEFHKRNEWDIIRAKGKIDYYLNVIKQVYTAKYKRKPNAK